MTRKLALLVAVSAVALLGAPLGAGADQIGIIGSNVGSITLTGNGTLVHVSIVNGTGGNIPGSASFQTATTITPGIYSFGAATFDAGPQTGEKYPALGATETFHYQDGAPTNDVLDGTVTWNFIQDSTTNPKFFGTMLVTNVSGTPDFLSTFPLGANNIAIDFTATALGGGRTLDELVAASGSATVGVSSGEVVPGPIVGAGLPGLLAACGGLVALGRRRRKQTA